MADPETPPHQGAGQHADLPQAAGQVAGEQGGKLHQSSGDPGFVHQIAGQDEGGNGQEGEILGLRERELNRHNRLQAGREQEKNEARNANGKHHRHAKQQQPKEN